MVNGRHSHLLSEFLQSDKLVWFIIVTGVALRLVRYLHNTPLWFDESVIATDIIKRSLFDLVNPSNDYTQTGPVTFYLLAKLSVLTFGNSEYALRLVPLCFGILSLFLFKKVADDILDHHAMLIALTLFALLDPLIYYSAELKPYSGDVFFTLLVLSAVTGQETDRTPSHIALPVVFGAIAVISSNPSVFVLAGAGLALLISSIRGSNTVRIKRTVIICAAWAAAFTTVYMFYTSKMTSGMAQNMSMERALRMEKFLMPFPPSSLKDVQWYIDFFFDTFLFQDSVMYIKRVTLSSLMAFSFLTGLVLFFREKRRLFYIMVLPLILTFLASALHIYPFKGRQILFLIPLFLLFISAGADYIAENVGSRTRVIAVVFLCLLFIYPVSWAAYHVKKPLVRSEIRHALGHVKELWKSGDVLYVHFFAQYEFMYYTKYHPQHFVFDRDDVIIGIGPKGWYDIWRKNRRPDRYNKDRQTGQSKQELKEEYKRDIMQLKDHKRAWVLFTGDTTMEQYFLSVLDSAGQRISSTGTSGLATVYLYEFKE